MTAPEPLYKRYKGERMKEPDVEGVIAKIDTKTFKRRYNHKEFEAHLIEALRSYRVTLETVVCSRGYSISSFTISKAPNLSRLSRSTKSVTLSS